MEIVNTILIIFCFLSFIFLIIQQNKFSAKINSLTQNNKSFLESIEKYIEIFNEQNINKYLNDKNITNETLASEKISAIKKDYIVKLTSSTQKLTDEQEMLVDFVTLTLSLLIKTPPNLRERLIVENTENDIIRKILLSKLDTIKKHYIPVSLIEIAISKEGN